MDALKTSKMLFGRQRPKLFLWLQLSSLVARCIIVLLKCCLRPGWASLCENGLALTPHVVSMLASKVELDEYNEECETAILNAKGLQRRLNRFKKKAATIKQKSVRWKSKAQRYRRILKQSRADCQKLKTVVERCTMEVEAARKQAYMDNQDLIAKVLKDYQNMTDAEFLLTYSSLIHKK